MDEQQKAEDRAIIARQPDGMVTPEQVQLLKRTLMPANATDDELALFVGQCNRTGLDPFARQIYAMRRRVWDADAQGYVKRLSIETSIDGLRLMAERTGKYGGQDAPMWCGEDADWLDVWLSSKPPAAAKVTVYRLDWPRGMTAIALYDGYVQVNREGKATARWASDPAGMLAKCAEGLALRKAFPRAMSGLYTSEEMSQAQNDPIITGETERVTETSGPAPVPSPIPAPAKAKHWIDDEMTRKHFWGQCSSWDMTEAGARKALGVARIHEYTGTVSEALNIIQAYAAQTKSAGQWSAEERGIFKRFMKQHNLLTEDVLSHLGLKPSQRISDYGHGLVVTCGALLGLDQPDIAQILDNAGTADAATIIEQMEKAAVDK